MKVTCFYPDYDPKHRQVLEAFARGAGADVRELNDYAPCNIAVIFGAKKNSYAATWPKGRIMELHRGRRLVMIESGFVLRGQYWQVGFGGFAGHADFRNAGSPGDRWERLGIEPAPWSDRPGGPVVVCGQLPWDTQVQDVDHPGWCRRTVRRLQRLGLRVTFRPHPRMKEPEAYGVDPALFDRRPMAETLAEARTVVTWNSTSGVDALVAGVPVVAMDRGSIAWPISGHQLEDALHPPRPMRRQFFYDMGYALWNLEEIGSGECWRHLSRPE